MPPFHGAWPALLTPSTPEGGVNWEVLGELTEYLLGKRVDGLYLCGATGEGLFMSVQERMRVAQEVVEQVRGRVPIIVHVGCTATRDAVELARHAAHAGAMGVSSVLPPLNVHMSSIYLHYESIASAVPPLLFFPYLYGGQADAVTLMDELARRIPNLGGAKYTGPNMFELHRLVELGRGRWTIFSGMDEQCVFAAMVGAPANIGSTLNLMPGVYREMRKCYEEGDLSRSTDLQLRANRVTGALLSFGLSGALREAIRLLGFDCGQPRPPNLPLPTEKRETLHEALDKAGLAELAAM